MIRKVIIALAVGVICFAANAAGSDKTTRSEPERRNGEWNEAERSRVGRKTEGRGVERSGAERSETGRGRVAREAAKAVAAEHMAHGRTEECREVLEGVLETRWMSRKEKKEVYGMLATNAHLAGDFASEYAYRCKAEGRRRPSSERQFAGILASLPEQAMERPATDVTVGYLVDSLFHEGTFVGCEIRLPVTIAGRTENLILDNGCAQFCVSSESFAKSHGIRPCGAGGNAIGVAGTASVWFGICDSLSIGDLVFRNLIFTVIPDELLDNSILEINAMLGANIFRLAAEMDFDNTKRTITFPATQQELVSNVTIDAGGVHYVQANIDSLQLSLQLDLGDARTSLSSRYYQANEEHIKSTWTEKKSHTGGVGGMKETSVYTIERLPITSCGGTYVQEGLEVSTESRPNEYDEFGSIGNDFLLSFSRAVLNLRSMFLYVE